MVQLTHDNRRKSVEAWACETGIAPWRILKRLDMGWSADRALTEPVGHQNRGRRPVPWSPGDDFFDRELFEESLADFQRAYAEHMTSGSIV